MIGLFNSRVVVGGQDIIFDTSMYLEPKKRSVSVHVWLTGYPKESRVILIAMFLSLGLEVLQISSFLHCPENEVWVALNHASTSKGYVPSPRTSFASFLIFSWILGYFANSYKVQDMLTPVVSCPANKKVNTSARNWSSYIRTPVLSSTISIAMSNRSRRAGYLPISFIRCLSLITWIERSVSCYNTMLFAKSIKFCQQVIIRCTLCTLRTMKIFGKDIWYLFCQADVRETITSQANVRSWQLHW